jgi:hypothetical protein
MSPFDKTVRASASSVLDASLATFEVTSEAWCCFPPADVIRSLSIAISTADKKYGEKAEELILVISLLSNIS